MMFIEIIATAAAVLNLIVVLLLMDIKQEVAEVRTDFECWIEAEVEDECPHSL